MLRFPSLASKIHPPLTLNPRETQKLLSLMRTSFRQNLDNAQPDSVRREERILDQHFLSILSNPQLNHKPHTRVRSKSTGDVERSIVHFKDQIAAGTATIASAKDAIANEKASNSELLPSILQWLWSSGATRTMEFATDSEFSGLLIPLMIKEDVETTVWSWMQKLQHNIFNVGFEARVNVLAYRNILFNLVRTKLLVEDTFQSGIIAFLEATVNLLETIPNSSHRVQDLVRVAGRHVSFHLTTKQRKSPLDPRLYDSFIRSVEIWETYHPHADYTRAYLNVRHPLKPSAVSAVEYLKTWNSIDKKTESAVEEKLSPQIKRRISYLSLDAAQLLLKQDNLQDSGWIMQFLSTRWPSTFEKQESVVKARHSIGRRSDQAWRTGKAELSNLQLLDRLATV